MNKLSPVLLAAAMLSFGCAGTEVHDDSRPVNTLTAPALARVWRADLDLTKDPITDVHVRDAVVIAYTQSARSYVIDRQTGDVKTVVRLDPVGTLQPPVLVPEGIAYPAMSHVDVYSDDGQLLRTIEARAPIRSAVVSYGSMLYGSVDQGPRSRMVAVNSAVPTSAFSEVLTDAPMVAAPAVYGDRVFFATTEGTVYAALVNGLTPVWSLPGGVFKTGGPVVADLFADETGVYVASADSKLYALSLDGQVKWSWFAGVPLRNDPAVTRNRVYIVAPEHGLVALDKAGPTTGLPREPVWTYAAGEQFLAESANFVFVRTAGNNIHVLDRATGEMKFTSVRNDLTVFGTNLLDGTVYAATANGQVLAIEAVTSSGKVGEQVNLNLFQPVAMAD